MLEEPPLPLLPDDTGTLVARPHGAVSNFQRRPPYMVHSDALVVYLRCLGMRIHADHPRDNADVQAHPEELDLALRSIRCAQLNILALVCPAFPSHLFTSADTPTVDCWN